jgi:hypothetical protein
MSKPSIEDFCSLLEGELDQRLARLRNEAAHIASEAPGLPQAGPAMLKTIQALHREFDAGVDAALRELNKVIKGGMFDQSARSELRRVAGQCLSEFSTAAKTAIGRERWNQYGTRPDVYFREAFATMDKHLQLALRHFDTGLRIPSDQEAPNVTDNSINISGSMTGSAIQQASPGANQTVTTINIDDVRGAVADLEARMAELSIPAETLSDIESDLATIRAQLSKSKPSHSIIREAAHSIRGVFEGVIASMVSPAVTAAIAALGKVTGAF